jgi:DNA primase small subunit
MRPEELVQAHFRAYYQKVGAFAPPRLGEREFGFMYFDKGFVRRHVGFAGERDLMRFLAYQVPAHAYHSTAYYAKPAASTMDLKEWRGADLIFDLDADHLRGAEKMSYEQMLAQVKVEMLRLLDDFILGDLGFSEEEVLVCFSGGRGYHAHVRSPRVHMLRSHERSEIVDYVSGTDLDLDGVFTKKVALSKDFKVAKKDYISYGMPAPESGGWRRRMRRGLLEMLPEIEHLEYIEAKARHPALARMKEQTYLGIREDLFVERGGKRGIDLLREGANLDVIGDRHQEAFLAWVKEELPPRLGAQVDEPVTRDIKRLIRLPGSLHGKTGMRVVPLRPSDLRGFEPLRDAFPPEVLGEDVDVVVADGVDVEIEGFRVRQGLVKMPSHLAVFLILRKMGALPQGSEQQA